MGAKQVLLSDDYASVDDFIAARRHAFPALHPKFPPAPVEGTGRLEDIYDHQPVGTGVRNVSVKALRIERRTPPHLVAYLDVPVNPELLEFLRSLSRGDRVTVSGIGHGPERYALYVYPVHRVNHACVGASS